MTIQELLRKHKIDPKDQKFLRSVFDFAEEAHKGQKRASGEPYVQHCLHTADSLATWGMLDRSTLGAALLHDVPENSDYTLDDIRKKFGDDITFLVLGITKLGRIKLRTQKDPTYIETLRRMVLAMAEDIRVILIKLADRLHNMNTLSALPRGKQERIALETLEVYAPLAARLGMGEVRGSLEDLAFPVVYPKEYNKLVAQVRPRIENAQHYIPRAIKEITKVLRLNEVYYSKITGRIKHMYSLYQKLQRPEYDHDLDKVFDIKALRIITDTVENCYSILGVIHKYFRPIPGRIKDYIAVPKPNGYQSLHTNIFGPEGKYIEIQIRTKKMDEQAEFGIASHWAYTETGKRKTGEHHRKLKKLEWAHQLSEWQKDNQDNPDEFFENLKIDFFKDRICVFTPKGDVKELPDGASTIDFAFAVHTDLGYHCCGAKINGKMSKLFTPLKNGDIVEIIEDKNPKVSRDWIDHTASTSARGKIKSYLNKNKEGFISRITPGFIKGKQK
ncbi:MAG: hypothetical protein COT91_04840 [Candidatus Doudnabacteria bacterium CG10_big_fil_rev_8_21_14_0_10_41_10]|uniref:TGS domain-containing protein n=1 Tax=Candidatus Doudnabacteria bacterium CG10_big_fil_rev_8_21_14_0_10_41_10 TaxID=1974551 RepID=A0A2H0VCF3_9BACT|nr:MAG: hypothetical protein COT91_04840 [Candidatus Doudnabacteria bacterium CG10_big_fil_rev_8_21_14_0_10_41_10]